MILSDTSAMKLIGVVFVIQALFLSTSVCAGCDNDCNIQSVPDSSTVSTFLGEVYATQEDIWVKLGDNFEKLIIQLKIDKHLDFSGEKISGQNLTLGKEDLFNAFLSPNMSNYWNKISLKVEKQVVDWAPDTYEIMATVGSDTFVKETGLWWRFNTIKTMQFLGKGGFEVSIGCLPCEPAESEVTPIYTTTSKSAIGEQNMTHVTEPTEMCGPSPWIYILVGIIGLLVLILVFLLVAIRYMYIRQNMIYHKRNLGLPYLEGNYFKEENIYDELAGGGKSKKDQDENIYDEIKSESLKPGPSQAFGASESAERMNADTRESPTSSPNKKDEDFYQSTPLPSPQTPENKFPSSDYSSLTSGASSVDGEIENQETAESSLDCIQERDRHLDDSKEEPCPPQSSPRCFQNPGFIK